MSFEETWQKLRGLVLENLRKHSFPTSDDQRHRTKRQATQHGCMFSLLGDGDKEIVQYSEEKIFSTGPTKAAKANKKLL
jgi:hypothetical protein